MRAHRKSREEARQDEDVAAMNQRVDRASQEGPREWTISVCPVCNRHSPSGVCIGWGDHDPVMPVSVVVVPRVGDEQEQPAAGESLHPSGSGKGDVDALREALALVENMHEDDHRIFRAVAMKALGRAMAQDYFMGVPDWERSDTAVCEFMARPSLAVAEGESPSPAVSGSPSGPSEAQIERGAGVMFEVLTPGYLFRDLDEEEQLYWRRQAKVVLRAVFLSKGGERDDETATAESLPASPTGKGDGEA